MILSFQGILPHIASDVFVAHSADIIGNVSIGEGSSIWFGVVIRGDVNHIRIGKNTNIQDLSMIHVTHNSHENANDGSPTCIGDNVTVGHCVTLHGCTIEDACLIGMSSTILDGAIIGNESIVAAGALVTKNKVFPPRSMIMGNPAKVVRELSDDEVASLYKSADNYVRFKKMYQ